MLIICKFSIFGFYSQLLFQYLQISSCRKLADLKFFTFFQKCFEDGPILLKILFETFTLIKEHLFVSIRLNELAHNYIYKN